MPPLSTLFPYTTLFRSGRARAARRSRAARVHDRSSSAGGRIAACLTAVVTRRPHGPHRSEEHTPELQSPSDLVCRLLLEKKKREASPTSVRRPAPDRAL